MSTLRGVLNVCSGIMIMYHRTLKPMEFSPLTDDRFGLLIIVGGDYRNYSTNILYIFDFTTGNFPVAVYND